MFRETMASSIKTLGWTLKCLACGKTLVNIAFRYLLFLPVLPQFSDCISSIYVVMATNSDCRSCSFFFCMRTKKKSPQKIKNWSKMTFSRCWVCQYLQESTKNVCAYTQVQHSLPINVILTYFMSICQLIICNCS